MPETAIALPGADESVACVDWARHVGAAPAGTALAPDVVALVEVREPWPKPALKHGDLAPIVRAIQARPVMTRVLAAVPHDPTTARVILFGRRPVGVVRVERPLGDDPLAAVDAAWADLESGRGIVADSADTVETVLICTQGSHDVCCGTHGVEFADQVDGRGDIEVFRVSHTGGHKWAPTAMTLPDGRMWAHLDTDSFDRIVRRDGPASAVAGQCRGWWGAPAGAAQAAEVRLLAQLGWGLDDQERNVEIDDTRVAITVGDERWHFEVTVARQVPAVMCSAPGGEPAKIATEWNVEPIGEPA